MEYVARVSKDGGSWLIDFPGAPGCVTQAETKAEIPAVAKEAIEGWLEAWLALGEAAPRPKRQPRQGLRVAIDPALAVAMELRWARADAGLTQAEVAARAGTSQQQIARLERAGQNPSIDTIWRVAQAIGVRPVVTFERDTPARKPARSKRRAA